MIKKKVFASKKQATQMVMVREEGRVKESLCCLTSLVTNNGHSIQRASENS